MVLILLIMLFFFRDLLCGEFLQKQPVCLWDWRGQWLSGSQGQVLLHLPQVSPYSCVWPPPSYLPIPSPIILLLPFPPSPPLPASLQETTSVQGDVRQTRGAHHCHQDRPRTLATTQSLDGPALGDSTIQNMSYIVESRSFL